jgi:hypothetical protein
MGLKPRFCGNVHIIQCQGRIVAGDEAKSLEADLDLTSREVAQRQFVNAKSPAL